MLAIEHQFQLGPQGFAGKLTAEDFDVAATAQNPDGWVDELNMMFSDRLR